MTTRRGNGNIMESMTVKDMIGALKRTRTAIIASGGTEQHGYHLPLSTDYMTAYEVAKAVSRRTGCLVPPPLCYSFSGGKLPGTTDISPETTTRVITEICLSLAEQGVRGFALFAGHCGGEHLGAIREAGYRIMEQAPGTKVAYVPVLSLSKSWMELLAGGGEHAGKGETSLVLHLRPDLVRADRPIDTDKTRRPRPSAFVIKDFLMQPRPKGLPSREVFYTYGVGGPDPNLATAEFGKLLFDEMVECLTDIVRRLEKATRS
ncbi:MAG: hypothetical protein A3K19_24645 [Lentisphaerae bacterium RIFOXYB12_FULL_65_16]|nr:MAG: hypothetical protein A3K18_17315 [Lentisphaerae bacterium RIFOXYA12_64_32]OGV84010.1 MAG: hypothetical protein A3K19_24645 [Lentisphaerae bacterium RIFOXYB12_FULL_65_16]